MLYIPIPNKLSQKSKMAKHRLFFMFAACVGLLGYATLSAAQGIPSAVEQIAKDLLSFPLNAIKMRLYGKDMSYKEFSPVSADTMMPFLNSSQKILIHVHGYVQSLDDPFVINLIRGYVEGYPFNVIGIDYKYCTYEVYTSSVILANSVSKVLLHGIQKLVDAGIDVSRIILSGFSLGAQIVGAIGRNSMKKIHKIIAMDPAGPMFRFLEPTITSNDAECVICIHSDANNFGSTNVCGHLDFYPNGGYRDQPGCNFLSSLSGCSHERATQFTAEEAVNPKSFLAIKCDSWSDFQNGNCNQSAIIPFGPNAPCSASGKYYLQTNKQQPFARNMAGTKYDPSIKNHFSL